MTNISKKGVWAIVLGSLAIAAIVFFAWATSGFVNWYPPSWFDYWGKAQATRVSEPPAEQNDMIMTSANTGLVYDSDEATYAMTKYRAPTVLTSGYIDTPISESGVRVCTPHNGTYAHGQSMQVVVMELSGRPLKTYNFSYSAVAPSYADGSCSHGSVFISYSDIRSLTTDPVVKISAYNIGSAPNYADSDFTSSTVYIVNVKASCSGTKYTIPRVTVDGFTSSYAIIAYNSGFTDKCFYNVPDLVIDVNGPMHGGYFGPGDFSYTPINNTVAWNSPAITMTDSAYIIDLTKLSFATELKDVNSVYVCPIALSEEVTYNGTTIDCILYNIPMFRFSISKLATPQNVTCVNGKITWDPVDGALGYGIFEGDNSWTVEVPEFDTTDKGFAAGEHTIRIRALGNVGQALATADYGIEVSAYNAAINITQLVTLSYNVDGDVVTKFVPHGSTMSGYAYEVKVPGKEFGGWYYDSGFSRPVVSTDTIDGDTTIYARLSDKKVAEVEASWWSRNKWYIIGAIIGLAVIGLAASAVVIHKKKSA